MATTSSSSTKSACVKKEEEGMARRFWLKFRKESVLSLYTPFVVCLASGNLRLDTFRHYIAQDAHFLKAFAQASVLYIYNTSLIFNNDYCFWFISRHLFVWLLIILFFWWNLIFRYELAEECADDDDAKVGMRELRNCVLDELKMHDSFVKVSKKSSVCSILFLSVKNFFFFPLLWFVLVIVGTSHLVT